MDDDYVVGLFEALKHTKFYSTEGIINEYGKGIAVLLDVFTKHKENGSRVFFVGNGGSAAIASHMTADFMKNGGMNTVGLYDSSVITCMGNDYAYEYIFSKQLEFLVQNGDLLIAISSSGNSMNIVNAIKTAKEAGAEVITFTGFDEDNKCSRMGKLNIYVPCHKYGQVETVHSLILQQVVDLLMENERI